jgi:predicted helicase
MDLHIGYESVKPWKLKRADTTITAQTPKALMKADKDSGRILIDTQTTLLDIPEKAWDYKLSHRSAIEWVLEQYKERTPKDPSIRERFNTYRLADYKEKAIDLLSRVVTVSVRTQEIVDSMLAAQR